MRRALDSNTTVTYSLSPLARGKFYEERTNCARWNWSAGDGVEQNTVDIAPAVKTLGR
ncbi:MAG: hypothetical protein ABR557_02335 [Pyrinomonadaceae bacterium]